MITAEQLLARLEAHQAGHPDQALEVALNLLHRGACGCETNTGDGAGLLLQVPDKFLRPRRCRFLQCFWKFSRK